MKKIALCIYTDNPDVSPSIDNSEYDIFFSCDKDKLYALKKVSVLKRLAELENKNEYELCVAFNPAEAKLSDINLSNVDEGKIYYAYGYFDRKRYVVGGSPSLFYAKSLEFNRACEFYDNLKNIYNCREKTLEEKFLYHIRSLFLKDECINYENSSLFIRAAEIN